MLSTEKKSKLIKEFQTSKNDTGSTEIQISILTETIKELAEHLSVHKKDVVAKRSLLKKVAQRRRLLTYLTGKDFDKYKSIIKKLNLRR